MKKVILKSRTGFSKNLMMAAIMLLSVSFVACNEDDDDDNNDDDENAQSGYFYYGEHSYLIVKEKKNWQTAMEDAKASGGYLVEIDSEAEQTAVYNAVKATVPTTYTEAPDGGGVAYVWLGGLDFYEEGTWLWNGDNESGNMPVFWIGDKNGTAYAYANWGVGEPDDYTNSDVSPNGQDFAALALEAWPKGNGSLGKAGQWNDIAGTNQLYYVVEFDTKKGDDNSQQKK
jgi:hypothetical protein